MLHVIYLTRRFQVVNWGNAGRQGSKGKKYHLKYSINMHSYLVADHDINMVSKPSTNDVIGIRV